MPEWLHGQRFGERQRLAKDDGRRKATLEYAMR